MRHYDLKDRRVLLLTLASLVLLLVVLAVTVRNLVVGTPDPKLPNEALFYTPPITRWDDKGVAERGDDFSARPLFSDARRPFEAAPAEAVSEAAQQQVAKGPAQTLEGWSLLGIFNSGEVEGAIIRQPDGSRSRVRVDVKVGDWRLIQVEERSVVFESERDGSEAELDMALGSLDGLVRAVPSGSNETRGPAAETEMPAETTDATAGDIEQPDEEAPKRDPRSFGGFYKDD